MSLPKVTIYTDGSCKPNPGPGGWGAVIIFNDKSCQEKGGELETTNNRMELTAPLKALQSLSFPHEVTLITDSMYLKNGITVWIHKWKLCGWKTVDNQSTKNRDLWEALDKEISRHKVIWKWVKGHTNNRFNELADQLASSARKRESLPLDSDGKIHIFLGVTWKHTIDKGAWAAILSYGNHIKIIGGAEEKTTANRLYIETAIRGLQQLKRNLPVCIYTFSGYLKDGAQNWLPGWERRNWVTRSGDKVSNSESWKDLKNLLKIYNVEFYLVEKENAPCLLLEAKEIAREFEGT